MFFFLTPTYNIKNYKSERWSFPQKLHAQGVQMQLQPGWYLGARGSLGLGSGPEVGLGLGGMWLLIRLGMVAAAAPTAVAAVCCWWFAVKESLLLLCQQLAHGDFCSQSAIAEEIGNGGAGLLLCLGFFCCAA